MLPVSGTFSRFNPVAQGQLAAQTLQQMFEQVQRYKEEADRYQKEGQAVEAEKYYKVAQELLEEVMKTTSIDFQTSKIFESIYSEYSGLLKVLGRTAEAAILDQKERALFERDTASGASSRKREVERGSSSEHLNKKNYAATPGGRSAQRALDTGFSNGIHSASISLQQPVAPFTQEKSALLDYLFETALSTLGSLKVSNKPSLFLVYAHDNPDPVHGRAEASTSKYLIDKLSQIQVKLHSDQTPKGQSYSSSLGDLEGDVTLEDILTSQLCLLPTRLRNDVKPVDKVVVCCSEVLGNYLKEWPHYQIFYQQLREAYLEDCKQRGDSAIRQVVDAFSKKNGFHHVLTEIAFLKIRAKYRQDHGIIPVLFTENGYEQCLKDFVKPTTVRIEDIIRLDEQAKQGKEIYPNQSRHWVLFKLIERLLVSSDEARTFLNQFWGGYSDFISQLKNEPSMFGELGFVKLVDGIFGGIRTVLHSQLALTVQQQQQQLRVLHADPKIALEEQYLAVLEQDQAFKETLQLYVEPRCKAGLGEISTFKLLPKVQELLDTKKVILLMGDSGAGKTTFIRMLEKQLWAKKKADDAIPLFISLPSIDKPEHDLIRTALKKKGLSEFQIQTLKQEKQKFVFILDGYDEIRQTQNLYLSNSINQSDSWQGHMVISCRSEYLGQDYRSRFQPNPNQPGEAPSFEEILIEPFSEEECNQYLEKYVKQNAMNWAMQRYQEALKQPHLKIWGSNPFLLRVLLEALPYLENEGKERSAVQLRMDLYDQFVRRWFERNQQRLSTQNLTGVQRELFRALSDDDFAQHGLRLVEDLAVHLYTENAGNLMVEYSLFKDKGNWKETFFGREEEKQLLREAWPLTRSGNQYRFIHKSLLEYLVARVLFDSFDVCIAPDTRRRGSDASICSFENEPVLPPRTQQSVALAPKHWVSDLGVVRWLIERVWQEDAFKQQLLAIIERSKTEVGVRQVAANAMTILVRAGVQFNGADLRGIKIPGADLSRGVFDSAHLEEADLRKVNFRQIWLRQAYLDGAQMTGVQFGEWPYLQEESAVRICTYSPNGKTCAVGLYNGKISLYDASSWKRIQTLNGHTGNIRSVVYSPSGQQIASGSSDKTVRVWNAQSDQPSHTLSGHTGTVWSVAYSPNGQQIVSGSDDKTVRIWDVHSGQSSYILKGHTGSVWSVVYSPSGQHIASCSEDNTVCLWGIKTGELLYTLRGHTSPVTSVAYSLRGQQLVSSSRDNTVRVWDAQNGQPGHILRGHTGTVRSVMYSPSGQKIISSSDDKTVRVWDVQSGQPCHTLNGHTREVMGVAYSPNGQQIVSYSNDKTVRVWDAQSGQLSHTLRGHTDRIMSVMYSPNGQQIISSSDDKTVRVWDVQSSQPSHHTLSGHTGTVWSVVYSPNGEQIASGSEDNTVRMWDAQSGQLNHTLNGHTREVSSVVYSPNGEQIASCSSDNTVRLWDTQSGESSHILRGHNDSVLTVAYSPCGQQIASCSWDKTVRLWDTHSGQLSHTLSGHTGTITSMAYSPNGEQIASCSSDNTVRLWDTQSGDPSHTLRGHDDSVLSVAYSPNGEQIASCSWDKIVRLWDTQSGRLRHSLRRHTGTVMSVAYSPSGEQIASCSSDNTVRLWDTQSGKHSYTLRGHAGTVMSMVYSPNGQQIASCSEDNTVRVWDATSGQCQAKIQDFSGAVRSIAWKKATSADHYLVTGCDDHSVRVWRVYEVGKQLRAILCWASTQAVLAAADTSIQNVLKLSSMNAQLLKQRGAVDGKHLANPPIPGAHSREARISYESGKE